MSALGKPSKELVLDEVNKKSTEVLSFADISFAPPAVNPGNLHDRNTSLLLTDIGGKYNGSTRTVFYNRLDLQLLFTNSGLTEVVLSKPEPFTSVLQLLDEINLTYGLALTAEDIEEGAPAETDEQTLVVKSTSYAYLNQLVVKVDQTLPPIELEDVIPNNILDGLNYPEGVTGLIRPIIVYSTLTGPGVDEDGVQLLGVDHPVRHYSIMTNDELTTAWSPRRDTAGVVDTIAPVDGAFTFAAKPGASPFVDLDITLIPKSGEEFPARSAVALYDIYVIANCSTDANHSFTYKLAVVADEFVLVDDATGAPVTGVQIESTADKLTVQASIDLAGNGVYEFAIIATRLRSIAHRLANVAQVTFAGA